MRDGRETTVLNLCSVERHRILWELEALLDQGGEFADAAALLAKDFLSVSRANDWTTGIESVCLLDLYRGSKSMSIGLTDISDRGRDADFDS